MCSHKISTINTKDFDKDDYEWIKTAFDFTDNKNTKIMKVLKSSFGLLLIICCVSGYVQAQNSQISKEDAYKIYSNLLGGKWETKGKWKSGVEYHQEVVVEMELTENIFTVQTYDHIDSKQFDNSQRNYGIRAWDNKEQKMKFWEFDVFGGITSGEIFIDNNNIYHIYQYPDNKGGILTLADVWIYVDKDTYAFKVCEFSDGKPGKEYLTSTYSRK